jgi:hypothetical protein
MKVTRADPPALGRGFAISAMEMTAPIAPFAKGADTRSVPGDLRFGDMG